MRGIPRPGCDDWLGLNLTQLGGRVKRTLALIGFVVGMLIYATGFLINEPTPVCVSQTEDLIPPTILTESAFVTSLPGRANHLGGDRCVAVLLDLPHRRRGLDHCHRVGPNAGRDHWRRRRCYLAHFVSDCSQADGLSRYEGIFLARMTCRRRTDESHLLRSRPELLPARLCVHLDHRQTGHLQPLVCVHS